MKSARQKKVFCIVTDAVNANTSTESADSEQVHDQDFDNEHEETTAAVLRYMIGQQELPCWHTAHPKIQDKMHALTCAAMALDIEEQEML